MALGTLWLPLLLNDCGPAEHGLPICGSLQADGSPNPLMLNDVAEALGVPRRRLYDVINVFESIEVRTSVRNTKPLGRRVMQLFGEGAGACKGSAHCRGTACTAWVSSRTRA